MKKNINKEENRVSKNSDIRGIVNNNLRNNDSVKKADSDSIANEQPNSQEVINSSLDNFDEVDTSKELKAGIKLVRKIIRIIIIPILISAFFFLLIFIAIITVLYMLDIFDIDSSSSGSNNITYDLSSYVSTTDNNDYWWPIGSRETTTIDGKLFAMGDPGSNELSAYFNGNDEVHKGRHFGIDISAGINEENVIASKDGKVIYPYADSPIDIGTCQDYYGARINCSGYGNYVMIEHNDGAVTLYGHMYENSITVREGDIVKQGQVIGKSGSSGDSTGGHLHFEIRPNGTPVDPLDYVSANNPRPGKTYYQRDVIN